MLVDDTEIGGTVTMQRRRDTTRKLQRETVRVNQHPDNADNYSSNCAPCLTRPLTIPAV